MFKEESRTKMTVNNENRPVKTSRKNVKRRSTFGIEPNIYRNHGQKYRHYFQYIFILTMLIGIANLPKMVR